MTTQAYQFAGGPGTIAVPAAPIISPRDPAVTDKTSPSGAPYEVGQYWRNSTSNDVFFYTGVSWIEVSESGTGPITTLTGNTGGAISPTAGNINILGNTTLSVAGSGSTLTITQTAAGFPITPYVVGVVGQAGYQTIQAAITAVGANAALIYVQPGTYTENLTFTAGSNISLYGSGYINTIITGVHTPPASGSVVIQECRLTSATHIFSSAVAGTARLSLFNTDVRVTSGYCFNLLNWTGELDVFSSTSVQGTNDGFLNNTGGATVFVINSDVGFGTGNAAVMTGVIIEFVGASLNCPATLGGAGTALFVEGCEIYRTFTTAGTSTTSIYNTLLSTGATAVISHGSAGTMILSNCTVTSSNNPAIAGAGAGVLTLGGVDFTSNTSTAGTLTLATTDNFKAGSFTSLSTVNATTTMTAGTGIVSTTGNIVATAGQVNAGTSMTAGTTLTATLGDITATNGNLVLNTAGNKIVSTSVGSGASAGANSFGTATLTGGTVTVSTTAVTASSIIILTRQSVGATGANDLGILSVGTIVAATSFEINAWTVTNATALQADDVSVIGWMIIN